jgi:hypothetical protein
LEGPNATRGRGGDEVGRRGRHRGEGMGVVATPKHPPASGVQGHQGGVPVPSAATPGTGSSASCGGRRSGLTCSGHVLEEAGGLVGHVREEVVPGVVAGQEQVVLLVAVLVPRSVVHGQFACGGGAVQAVRLQNLEDIHSVHLQRHATQTMGATSLEGRAQATGGGGKERGREGELGLAPQDAPWPQRGPPGASSPQSPKC